MTDWIGDSAAMPGPLTRRHFIRAATAIGVVPGPAAAAAASGQTAGTVSAPPAAAVGGRVEKDVVFGTGGEADLRCDLYHPPAGAAKRMALIHYHGGGFTRGSKDTLAGKLAPFAALGYLSIAAQYRLAGAPKWPAQLHDVKTAIRWTRANAVRLGIDPERIGLVGYSAGGFLVLNAAGTQNRPEFEGTGGNAGAGTSVASVFAFYPATDLAPGANGGAHVLMPAGSDAAAHRAASPVNHVAALVPTVLFHGVADSTIPLANSQRLFERLQAANVPAELHAYAGVPHEFDVHAELAAEVARAGDVFLERHVLHPKVYPPFGLPRRQGDARGLAAR